MIRLWNAHVGIVFLFGRLHVANGVIGDGLAVVIGQQIAPGAGGIGVVFRLQRRAQSAGGVGVLLDGGKLASAPFRGTRKIVLRVFVLSISRQRNLVKQKKSFPCLPSSLTCGVFVSFASALLM